ncbi:GumC family protein [Sphingomonas sp. ac-8]|uniref:GumC family protein n=1 Tax=Sphingomonas sp. ac-8 TaxID=3242977 RepID=UPI003A7FA1A7
MGAGDLVAAVLVRWRLVVALALGVVLAVAGWTLAQPRLYRASASVLFNVAQGDPANLAGDAPQTGGGLLATQGDVLRSALVARQVAVRLGLAEGSDAAARDRAAAMLRGKVAVANAKASNVMIVSGEDGDPVRAAAIANAFAETYLAQVPQLRAAAARGYSGWLAERTRDVRARLEGAQQALEGYQRRHGLVGSGRFDLDAEALRTLNAELAQAEGAAAEAQSRAGSSQVPEVTASLAVQQLRTSVAAQAGRVAELSRTLGPSHPDMQAATAQLAALRGQLSAAIGSAAQSMQAASTASQRREASVRARLAARERAMIAGAADQNRLAVLQRDVDAAQQSYDQVRKELGEQFLRSQAGQANASLLDRATPPALPYKPDLPLMLVLGTMLGIAVGLATVIGLELRAPRVRTDRGVELATGAPVFALG